MIKSLPSTISSYISLFLSNLISLTTSLISVIADFVIGVVLSIYLLLEKEKLKKFAIKLSLKIISKEKLKKILNLSATSYETFESYIFGQLVEAVILGTLCFVGMIIFSFPHPAMISSIIGVTGLIPVAGAFIGAFPAIIIILLTEPSKALWFLAFILVIQQIEGDFIYPKIVGRRIGLSPFWVLTAIIIGGGVGGILGMFFAVPLVSVVFKSINVIYEN